MDKGQVSNYISIYDNTASANYVYLSESVAEILGWKAEELVGKACYSFFHPNEIRSLKRVHAANVMNEKMSSMVSYRHLHKDGHYVTIETLVHYCYDVLMCTNFLYDPTERGHKIRHSTADEVYRVSPDGSLQLVGAWNDHQDHMKHALQVDRRWVENKITHPQEERFCVILNRFTEDCIIVYISKIAEKVVGLYCEEAVGRSIYYYVHERDVDTIRAQIDMAKTTDMVIRLRFDWIVDHERNTVEEVEAITSASTDGLVLVVRRSPQVNVA